MAGGGKHSNASAFKKKSSTVTQHEEENSLALVLQPVQDAPIISSYNDRIRPLLDAVDKLRHLMITREGIQLPTMRNKEISGIFCILLEGKLSLFIICTGADFRKEKSTANYNKSIT